MISIIFIAVLVAIDQLTKICAKYFLTKGANTFPVIPGVFSFTYVENTGSAFGMFKGQRVILSIVVAIIVFAIVYLLITNKYGIFNNKVYKTVATLIAAGGVGNLLDRVFRGYVVDFLDFNLINFPVFNIADICVTIGAAIMIIYVLFFEMKNTDEKLLETEDISSSNTVDKHVGDIAKKQELHENTAEMILENTNANDDITTSAKKDE